MSMYANEAQVYSCRVTLPPKSPGLIVPLYCETLANPFGLLSHTSVLLRAGNCGVTEIQTTGKSILGYSNLSINITSISQQYARSCYSGAGSLSAVSCDTYTVPSLPYSMHLDEPVSVPLNSNN